MRVHLLPRRVKHQEGGLRPFQRELLEAIESRPEKIILVEAPVGAGKSYILRHFLREHEKSVRLVIFTYPTKILMDAQVGSVLRDMKDISVWPYRKGGTFTPLQPAVILYSTDSLIYAIKNGIIPRELNRGKLLHTLFNRLDWFTRHGVVVTSPDVLWLICHEGAYHDSKRLQSLMTDAIVFFDEFHTYSELANFPILVNELASRNIRKIVLLSATPFVTESLRETFEKHGMFKVSFDSSISEEGGKTFNYDIDLEICSFRFSDINKTIEQLLPRLDSLPRPVAYISDSIFRIQHLKRILARYLGDMEIVEWSGFEKDIEFRLTESTLVLGTSAIEVGIDMQFSSLILEARYWTSAVQRLGRVGRKSPGQAVMFTRKAVEPFIGSDETWDRTSFENQVLKEMLADPSEDIVYGAAFRGESFNFVIVDDDLKRAFIYDEAIFAMYDIEDYVDEWRTLKSNEKRECLYEFGVPVEKIEDILLRDELFPLWGVLRGTLAKEYLSRPQVKFDSRRNELNIFARKHFVFYGE